MGIYNSLDFLQEVLQDVWDSAAHQLKTSGSGGGGGGGGAVTVADGADVAQGTKTDGAWDGSAASASVISILKKVAVGVASGGAVSIADNADVAQGAKADAAWTSGSGSVVALLKAIAAKIITSIAVTQADGSSVAIGALADAAVVTSASGSVSAKLRGIVSLLAGGIVARARYVAAGLSPADGTTHDLLTDSNANARTNPGALSSTYDFVTAVSTIADGANIAQGAVADAAWTVGNGTVISLLKAIATKVIASVAVTQADASNVTQGAIADAAWTSGSGTVVSLLKAIAAKIISSVAVTQADASNVTQGAVADVAWTTGSGTVVSLLKAIAAKAITSIAVTIASLPSNVGATNIATASAAPTGAAATAVIARATRTSVTFVNTGGVTLYFGPATVSSSNGASCLPGASRTFTWVGLIQVIVASGTGAYDVVDEYN